MIFWYDKSGRVIGNSGDGEDKHMRDMQKIEALLKDHSYKIIGQDYTPDRKYWISTVWLVLDHSFGYTASKPNPHPIIFETIVFPNEGDRIDYLGMDECRYETESQAIAGHKRMLAKWSKKRS